MVYTSLHSEMEVTSKGLFDMIFNKSPGYDINKKLYIDGNDPSRFITFAKAKDLAQQCAASLKREFGLQKGDVVVGFSPNDLYYPTLLHGILASGCIGSSVDLMLQGDELFNAMDIVQPKLIVAHQTTLDRAIQVAQRLGVDQKHILVFGDKTVGAVRTAKDVLFQGTERFVPQPLTAEEARKTVAYFYFTSGTTGITKAVQITHRMIETSLQFKQTYFCLLTRGLAYTEFHHVSSLWLTVHGGPCYNIETYILPSFSLEHFCELVQNYRIIYAFVQPWIALTLAKEQVKDKYDLSSLKVILSGGSAIEKSVASIFGERYNANIINVYGLTEATGLFKNTAEITCSGGVGKLERGITAKLIDKDGNEVPDGEKGELCIRGPTVTPGYYNNDKATAEAFDKDGYYHTGDDFYVDKDGIFYFVGRRKELIKYFLTHIHPQAIEDVLVSHPKVADCGVAGIYVPADLTEVPRGYVTLVDGVSVTEDLAKEILDYTNSKLPDTMHLRGGLYIVDALPRTATGKVLRRKLVTNIRNDCVRAAAWIHFE